MCIYDGEHGGEAPQHWTHWGRHYEEYERDLSRTEVLPYLKNAALFAVGQVEGKPADGEALAADVSAFMTDGAPPPSAAEAGRAIKNGYRPGVGTPGGSFAF